MTLLRGLKACVRNCDSSLRIAVATSQSCLRAADDSLRRLGGLLVLDHLFSRSRLARSLVTAWLPELLVYCTRPLPPPAAAAERLSATASSCLQAWQAAWGAHYAQVGVALQRLGAEPRLEAPPEQREVALDVQRFRALLPLIESAYTSSRAALAAADRTVSLLAASAAPVESPGEEEWEDVEPPTHAEQLMRIAPRAGAGAFEEALRASLADLHAAQPELENAISQVSAVSVEGRGTLLAEGLQLRAAIGVTRQRLRALLGDEGPAPPPPPPARSLPPPSAHPPPPAAREAPSSGPRGHTAALRRERLEKAMARLRTPRGHF